VSIKSFAKVPTSKYIFPKHYRRPSRETEREREREREGEIMNPQMLAIDRFAIDRAGEVTK
jgi:hypothetical protein